MTRWTNETRKIPQPTCVEIIPGIAWQVTLNFNGEGSSIDDEARSLPLNGFGSCLFHDYFVLAEAAAVRYIKENGWRLDHDNSSVAGIDMMVYRPEQPSQLRPLGNRQLPHRKHAYNSPCVHCGAAADTWTFTDNCPAKLEIGGFECLPAQAA